MYFLGGNDTAVNKIRFNMQLMQPEGNCIAYFQCSFIVCGFQSVTHDIVQHVLLCDDVLVLKKFQMLFFYIMNDQTLGTFYCI